MESFKLAQPDFVDREHKAQRTNENQPPVAVLRLKITNNGGGEANYQPLHFADASRRIQVCTKPDPQTGDRTNVAAISFAETTGIHIPTQRIDRMVSIPAGKTIYDDYLFDQPMGDQPQAIRELVEGFRRGNQFETLLGVTGSGKTFSISYPVSVTDTVSVLVSISSLSLQKISL